MTVIDNIRGMTTDNLGALTILAGEDRGQYQLAKAELLEKLGFDAQDLAYSYFDAADTSYDQVELDLQSLPFFSDEKIVFLDNLEDLTTSKKRHWSDEELKRFEAYLEAPNQTTKLILLVPGKLDAKRRLVKLLKRDGVLLEANPLKEAEFRAFFKKEVTRHGLTMSASSFDQLVMKAQLDLAQMSHHLTLLKAYRLDGVIEEADIAAAIPKTLQDNLFDLSQFILAGKIEEVRSLVADLRLQGEDEIKLVAILLSQFRLYMQLNMLQGQGKSDSQLVSELSSYLGRSVHPFQVKNAMRDSRGLSFSTLKQLVIALTEADYQMKTGMLDKQAIMDTLLLKLVALGKRIS